MNNLVDIDGIVAKHIAFVIQLHILLRALLLRMILQVPLNQRIEAGIPLSRDYLFPALRTIRIFCFNKPSQTVATESMVARMDRHWQIHDLEADAARNLLLNRLQKII